MKKALLITIIAGFSLTSCKKDYSCSCTSASFPSVNVNVEILKHKKSDAKDACNNAETIHKNLSNDLACELSKK